MYILFYSEEYPVYFTLFWRVPYVFYSMLKSTLHILLYPEEYSVYFTLLWRVLCVFYSILKSTLYILLYSEEYSLYFTLFWKVPWIFYSILKSTLYILPYYVAVFLLIVKTTKKLKMFLCWRHVMSLPWPHFMDTSCRSTSWECLMLMWEVITRNIKAHRVAVDCWS
jgi:hypothetical protein